MIRSNLEDARKKTKPRKIDLYDVFRAILYVIKNDYQWRMLPSDFPKWKTVYFYDCIWSGEREEGATLLSEVLKKWVKMVRNEDLRKDKTTFGIIGAQSVQNAKRHIVVDTQGLPHAVIVTAANVTDRQGAIEMITLNVDNLSSVK